MMNKIGDGAGIQWCNLTWSKSCCQQRVMILVIAAVFVIN